MGILHRLGSALKRPSVHRIDESYTEIEGLKGCEVRCRNGLVTVTMHGDKGLEFGSSWLTNVIEALQRIQEEQG